MFLPLWLTLTIIRFGNSMRSRSPLTPYKQRGVRIAIAHWWFANFQDHPAVPDSEKQQIAPQKSKHQGPGCPSPASCTELLVLSIGNQPLVFNRHGRCCNSSGAGMGLPKWLRDFTWSDIIWIYLANGNSRCNMVHQQFEECVFELYPKTGMFQLSKEVWKSNFRQYRPMEKQRWEESEKDKESEERRCRCAKR